MDEIAGTRSDHLGTSPLTDNNTVTYATGLRGNSASFVTANWEFLSAADNPAISTGDIDFTLVANVYLSSASTLMVIANKGLASSNIRDYLLAYDPSVSKIVFSVGNGSISGSVLSQQTVTAGQWYTIIAWHDALNNSLNIQINNGSVSSVSYSSGAMDTAYPLSIGAHSDGSYGLNGRMDEMVLYKRVLTSNERFWIYNNGMGRTYADLTGSNPGTTNLAAWWSLNETSGARYDSLGISTLTSNNNVSYASGLQGNYIGTDITGTVALGNVFEGIFVGGGSSNNVIGGTVAGAGNLISGNNGYGVTIADMGTTGNVVQGNYIGTDVTGTLPLGNSDNGIIIATDAMDNLIGGTANGAGNVIAFNSVNGIVLTSDAGNGNAISSNSIHSNSDLGIDLAWDGVTLYDLFDLDSGANDLQNSPILTMVKNTGQGTVVQGVLVGGANKDFRLEFFTSEACDPSGHGEGQTYLGSLQVGTNAIGRASFRITLPASFAVDGYVTATAADSANNTSEFSNCIMVSP